MKKYLLNPNPTDKDFVLGWFGVGLVVIFTPLLFCLIKDLINCYRKEKGKNE